MYLKSKPHKKMNIPTPIFIIFKNKCYSKYHMNISLTYLIDKFER